MIVLNNKEHSDTTMKENEHPYIEMFRKEIDAYCAYKALIEETEDEFIERAFEEIMQDEYLHAKFLHDYLMDHDLYWPENNDEHEKKFWKIHRKYFK
jgi:bacterioferritin (cytochrome b1)